MTQWLVYLFDLPIQAWADRALADFGPLRAGRAGNIDVERQRALVHEITAHAK